MRDVIFNEEEVKKMIKEHRDEQDVKSREKIKEYFITGQLDPEVAVFALRLLGVSAKKGKELIKQWESKL